MRRPLSQDRPTLYRHETIELSEKRIKLRVVLLILAVATAAAGLGAAVLLDVRAGYFECPHCGALFVPTAGAYVKGLHTFTRRQLTCPECGRTGMCKKRLTRKN